MRVRSPEAFRTPPPPLAIGIHLQILDIAGATTSTQSARLVSAILDAQARIISTRSPTASRAATWTARSAGEPDEQQRRAAAAAVYGRRAEAVLARIAARRAAEMEATP